MKKTKSKLILELDYLNNKASKLKKELKNIDFEIDKKFNELKSQIKNDDTRSN